VRDGRDWQTPHIAQVGPKVMLTNGWSGSGGDCFPWLFRENKLGPIIGTRTWGGLIGMTGAPGLVDGGHVTVPTFGIYDTAGKWIIEGHGVDPISRFSTTPPSCPKATTPSSSEPSTKSKKRWPQTPPRRLPSPPIRIAREVGKEPRAKSQGAPVDGSHFSHWVLDVGCWMLDVLPSQ